MQFTISKNLRYWLKWESKTNPILQYVLYLSKQSFILFTFGACSLAKNPSLGFFFIIFWHYNLLFVLNLTLMPVLVVDLSKSEIDLKPKLWGTPVKNFDMIDYLRKEDPL